MRNLAQWEIDSLRRQHAQFPIRKGHEVRDDTEPGGRRLLTDDELYLIGADTIKTDYSVDPTRTNEDLRRDMDSTKAWLIPGMQQRYRAWGQFPPGKSEQIQAMMPRGAAYHLAMEILRLRTDASREHAQWSESWEGTPANSKSELSGRKRHYDRIERDWADSVLAACQRAMKAQDELISHYQRLESERAVMRDLGTTAFILPPDRVDEETQRRVDTTTWAGPKPSIMRDYGRSVWICSPQDAAKLESIVDAVKKWFVPTERTGV